MRSRRKKGMWRGLFLHGLPKQPWGWRNPPLRHPLPPERSLPIPIRNPILWVWACRIKGQSIHYEEETITGRSGDQTSGNDAGTSVNRIESLPCGIGGDVGVSAWARLAGQLGFGNIWRECVIADSEQSASG